MTNIKTRGFDSRAELQEHLEEIDDEAPADDPSGDHDDLAVLKEIAWLRKEVADLREHLSLVLEKRDDVEMSQNPEANPWMRLAGTIATTYVLGRLVQRLRLGALGAVTVPIIVAQIDRRLW